MAALPEPAEPLMTVEAFLDWPGDDGGTRYQLVDGEPVAMAPASADHAFLQAALLRLLENHVVDRGSPCRAATEAPVAPRLGAHINVRVPDVAVTCLPDRPDGKLFPDPVMVAEILSPGNARDTRANLWVYASIPSVRGILLVHSTRISTRIGAELHRRQADGAWPELRRSWGRTMRWFWTVWVSAVCWPTSTPAPGWRDGGSADPPAGWRGATPI